MRVVGVVALLTACGEPDPERPRDRDTDTEVVDTDTGPKQPSGPPARLSGELSVGSADVRLDAPAGLVGFGTGVAAAGDVDADGIDDALFAASGATLPTLLGEGHGQAWLVRGGSLTADARVDEVAAGAVTGVRDGDLLGRSMTPLGDWNGDGFGDFAVSAPSGPDGNGRVAVVHGPLAGSVRVDTATALLSAPSRALAGTYLIGGVDYTGDGRGDLAVVSSISYDHEREEIWILSEPLEGDWALDDVASAKLVFPAEAHGSITAANAGDLDGDGLPSLAVAAILPTQLYLFDAPLEGTMGPETATHVLTPDTDHVSLLRVRDAGDSDGDGYTELPVGIGEHQAGAGIAYLLGDPGPDVTTLEGAAVATLSRAGTAALGVDLAFVGDLDGDGRDDLVVGAISDVADAGSPGAVYLVYGPVVGAIDLAQAHATLLGEGEFDATFNVGRVGDLDGDGYADLAIGGPSANPNEGATGSVYLFLGGSQP